MNILIDELPTEVTINNRRYEINSDFRTSVLFELLINDGELSESEKLVQGLKLYYPIIPDDLESAIDKITWFYSGGKEGIKTENGTSLDGSDNIYDFEYDADYIYSAFLDQYGIDLQDIEYLHWWKFKAMFNGLKSDNKIVEIMGYRGTDLSDIGDKDQKDFYKKMQKLYEIPKSTSEKEKINSIEDVLLNGGDLSKVLYK